jgi:hypothetical protein
MYPTLSFALAFQGIIDYDFEMYKLFLSDRHFDNGSSFKEAVVNPHDFFKQYFTGEYVNLPDSAIKDYIRNTHSTRNVDLRSIILSYQKSWEKVSAQYFILLNELFTFQDWPGGMYMGYPTIWSMYPRKIETCTFSFPVNCKNINIIVAHEFLHFIFYNYVKRRFPGYMNLNDGIFIWDVSEIFNILLQNSDKWVDVFQEKSQIYSQHKKIIEKLSQSEVVIQPSDLDAIISLIMDEVEIQI